MGSPSAYCKRSNRGVRINDNGTIFAQRLIAARMLKGWGPRELAKQACTYSFLISLYESRQRVPTRSELGALANALGVKPDDLWPSQPVPAAWSSLG